MLGDLFHSSEDEEAQEDQCPPDEGNQDADGEDTDCANGENDNDTQTSDDADAVNEVLIIPKAHSVKRKVWIQSRLTLNQ